MKNFIIFLTLTFPLYYSTIANGANIVQNTCKKISGSEPNVKYNFCVKVLGSNPRSATSNLEQLVEISFNSSITKAKSIENNRDAFENPKYDVFQKNALEGCKEVYSNVRVDLGSGLKAFKDMDYNTANVLVSGVITYADTCEDGFRERREFSPLSLENNDFLEFSSISLVFTNLFLLLFLF